MKQLKQLIGLVAALFIFTACQSDIYYIRGEARQLPSGCVLYLTDDLNANRRPFDSIVVSDGRFHYQGIVDKPHISKLYPAGNPQQGVTFFTEPGNIYIELSSTTGRSRVSGTVINNRWQALNDSVTKYDCRIRRILGSSNDTIIPRQRYEETQQLFNKLTQIIRTTAVYNKNNVLGHFISTHYEQ